MNELDAFQRSVNVSTAMLIVTLIIAVATITFGALNMAFQRSHNIKSVRPFCNIHQNIFLEKGEISIRLMNAGLGPMIIRKVALLPKDASETKDEADFKDVIPAQYRYENSACISDLYVLPSMGEIALFRYTGPTVAGNTDDIGVLRQTLERYILCIHFEDIYEHAYVKKDGIQF